MTRTSAGAVGLLVLADGVLAGEVEAGLGAGWNSAIASPTAANWSFGLRIFRR
ncbi:MAG: hypothetical protein ACKO9Q_09495 [Pirellula sp.]